jgi:methionyl-tRNA formyltransferase
MKIIFMGTPDFSVPTLDAIVAAGHEVLAVVAQPDRPSGRGQKLTSPPTIVRARELGLVTKQPRAVRRGPFVDWMVSAGADVAVVVAYGRILPEVLLTAPARGCINVHASLLPRYRGAAPIHRAVIAGERQTGVTTMQMDVGLDTGDMLLTATTPVGPDEDTGTLWERLSHVGAELLVETLQRLDTITPTPQDHAAATHAPPLDKSEGQLDWRQPARTCHDLVRGMSPWPGAFAMLGGERIKIQQTRPVAWLGEPAAPGTIHLTKRALIVATGDDTALEILTAQRPGKRAQPGIQVAQGLRLTNGDSFQ